MSKKQKDYVPSHVAIIMDGNRRWARVRGLPDLSGHEAGADALERIVGAASKIGIKTITVYALSTENIRERAKREVLGLFGLLRKGYRTRLGKMAENGVGVTVLGEIQGLPKTIQKIIGRVRSNYIQNESVKLNIALNYGGKRELLDAVRKIIKEGVDVDKIDEESMGKYLYTHGQTDPELVIRTGGRVRLSNFLIWQTAYSELYFTKTLWPDFGSEELKKAVLWYQKQQRNFGK